MILFDLGLVLVLILTIIGGLIRVMSGPTAADRMLTAQLFATASVAILLLLAETMNIPPLQDVALVFALLTAIAGIAFVQRIWDKESRIGG
jgi:multicomponent Na+:H+ antiporter subunit F